MFEITYQTLEESAKEIRLLIIEDEIRNLDQKDSPLLRCHLVKTSLNLHCPTGTLIPGDKEETFSYTPEEVTLREWTDTPFQALSYVWGDPTPVSDIQIDGQVCKIPMSLSQALLSIRDNITFRVIWADALCINQGDNQEKSWQVQQMVYLYSRAERVIAWLGPEDDQSTVALESLERFGRTLTPDIWKYCGFEESRTFVALSQRTYWSRIWIFQEFTTARSVDMLCGSKLVYDCRNSLIFLIYWFLVSGVYAKRTMPKYIFVTMVLASGEYRHARETGNATATKLGQMLIGIGNLGMTDPRDGMFACLGLASNKDTLGLRPDYSRSVQEVLLTTAQALIRMESVGLIRYADRENRKKGLPSWVPIWSNDSGGIFYAKSYNASGERKQRESTIGDTIHRQNQENIILDGYVVDIITEVLPTCSQRLFRTDSTSGVRVGAEDGQAPLQAIIKEAEGMINLKKPQFVQEADALARTLVADSLSAPVDTRIEPNVDANQWLLKVKEAETASPEEDFPILEGFDDLDHMVVRYIDKLSSRLKYRARLFFTKNGYLGLSQQGHSEVGDLIVILPGSSIPSILRKETQSLDQKPGQLELFEFICEAYVHGIMDGQFLAQDPPLRTFTLH